MILGDFNMVEDAIDRFPMHEDRRQTIEAFDDLKCAFHQSATGSQSRIDRIYVSHNMAPLTSEWRMDSTGIPHTDHRMVSAYVPRTQPPNDHGPGSH